ncbi:MAG: alkaline phosphatase [Bifidobacteriaceae bacterium]|jgi:alkaline phosphatase|nr:alkaline phosphatase [Bifidobacteriaceae bacterium]
MKRNRATRRALTATLGVGLVAALGMALPVAPATAAPQPPAAAPAAKNIIVLISDGAGYNQFDIASLYRSGNTNNQVRVDPATGWIERVPGTPTQVYESYPVQVAQSHYSANGRADYDSGEAWGEFNWVYDGATDSAAAATALGTGVKTNNGTLGFTPATERLTTITEHASDLGKATGLVTSVTFNHATPAGFVAHNADRNDYHGLATEMIDSDLNVIMGAGHPLYDDANTDRTPTYQWISEADYDRVSSGQTPYAYIEDRAGFEALAEGGPAVAPERVFGLAQVAETLQYNRPGLANSAVLPGTDPRNDVPDLDTMAKGALNVLAKDRDGFFLMIEGGAVDWAGHANQTTRLIEEQVEFNGAVEAVDAWVNANSSWDETLVIITADHETGYLSGPGADPTWTPMTGQAGQLPDVTWHSGGHTNALVPLFAKGAGSELLTARAESWDAVRGAYLDNTDVGNTLFDLFGPAYSGAEANVPLELALGLDAPGAGALSLKVAAQSEPVRFVGSATGWGAALPAVTVRDTRTDVQARAGGWTVAGRADDFTAGNRVIGAENLGWSPRVVSSEGGAGAGQAGATLDGPATLAAADQASRGGTSVVGADLTLVAPSVADSGRYGSEITLTLFAID